MRKVPLLIFACLLGLLAERIAGFAVGAVLGVFPADWSLAAPAAAILSLAADAARFFVTGFIFWSGTSGSVLESAAWAVLGGTAFDPVSAAVISLSPRVAFAFARAYADFAAQRPVFFAALLLARAAGGFLGARFGDDNETNLKVHAAQELIFRLYPFRLPR